MNRHIIITLVLGFVMLLFAISSSAQSDSSVIYFKDRWESKKAKEKNAKYKRVTSISEDGTITIELLSVKGNKAVYIKHFKEEQPIGIWTYYNEAGGIKSERNFDRLIYSDVMVKDGKYFTFDKTESLDFTPPKFPGEVDVLNYLALHVRYPQESKESGAQGIIYNHIKIEKDGEVVVVSVMRGVDPYLDYESFRVMDSMPNWIPATQNGEPIVSYTIIPIRFLLR